MIYRLFFSDKQINPYLSFSVFGYEEESYWGLQVKLLIFDLKLSHRKNVR